MRYQRGCSGSDILKTHCIDRFRSYKVFNERFGGFSGLQKQNLLAKEQMFEVYANFDFLGGGGAGKCLGRTPCTPPQENPPLKFEIYLLIIDPFY